MSIVELIQEELPQDPEPSFGAQPIEVLLDEDGEVHLAPPPANDTTTRPSPEHLN